jgi:signal transduction histidine kinase
VSADATSYPADDGQAGDAQVIRRVGHDLRNKLAILQNSVYYLNMKLEPADPKVRKHLDILAREIAQGNLLTMNLMDLLAAKAPEPAQIDGLELLQRAVERAPAPAGVELRLEDAGASPAWVDVDQMIHALPQSSLSFATLGDGGVMRLVAQAAARQTWTWWTRPSHTFHEHAALLIAGAETLRWAHVGLAWPLIQAQVNGGRLQYREPPAVGTALV